MFKKIFGFTLSLLLINSVIPAYSNATQNSLYVLKNILFQHTSTQITEEPFGWGLDFIDRASDESPFNGLYEYDSTGMGVEIYIIDDAVNPNISELSNISLELVDVTPDKGTVNENLSCGTSHGTEVASIIAGKNIGVAKNVKIISVKAASCAESGTGQLSYVSEAIQWILENHDSNKTAIVNMSFSGIPTTQEQKNAFETIINALTLKNLIPVAAAGNASSDACTTYPAAAAKSISVASLSVNSLGLGPRESQTISAASYSNDGACVDVWAPGTLISSQGGINNYSSGTSMAAPVVSAVLARILEKTNISGFSTIKNNLLVNNTTELIFSTTRPTTKKAVRIVPAQLEPPVFTPPNESVAGEIINKPVIVAYKGQEITSNHAIVFPNTIISIEVINLPPGFMMYYNLDSKTLTFKGVNTTVQKTDAQLIVIRDDSTKYSQNVNFLIKEVTGKRTIKTEKTGKNKFSLVISNPDIGKKITVVNYNSKGKQIFKKTYTIKTNELGQYIGLRNNNQLRVGLTLPTSSVRTDVWIGGKKIYTKRTYR